jgi:hypothetical protein
MILPKEPIMKAKIPFLATALVCLSFATSALAGPPLLCHTFDIGDAKSLPWTGHSWNISATDSYDTRNLAADTLSILDGDPTVLVHMETLRRAALYAQKDPVATKRLLLKLIARSDAASIYTPAGALATFDTGYLAATLDQVHWINKDFVNPAQGLDAYGLVKNAIQHDDNPEMNFAAALITLDMQGTDQLGHAKKALVGGPSDPLLARNLSTRFMGPQTETMTEMINRNSNSKVARK